VKTRPRRLPLAFAALAVLLTALAGTTVRAWQREQAELEQLATTIRLAAAYDHAVDSVNVVRLRSLDFVNAPTPAGRAAWDASLDIALTNLRTIAAIGGPDDRALAESTLVAVEPDLAATRELFDSLLAGTPYLGRIPRADSTDLLRAALTAPADRHRLSTQQHIEGIIADERRELGTTLATYGGAVALIVAFVLVVRRHELGVVRVRAQAELEQLRRAAFEDILTGLPNLNSFTHALADAAAGARFRDSAVTIAVMDVDEFRLLAEQRGAEGADATLRRIADVLRGQFRGDEAFRLAGDRFAVVLGVPQADARTRLGALRSALVAELPYLTVSIGASTLVGAAIDPALLRDEADAALRAAKRRGRDTLLFYTDAGEVAEVAFTGAKVNAVRRAIAERRMDAAFQPIFDLHSGELRAFEALARPPADLGLDGPQEAFDIADRIGHAHDLDSVCRAAVFAAAAALPPGVQLFLNIAPAALLHRDFSPERLALEASAAGIDPWRVVVEVTERSGVPAATLAAYGARLRAAGFRLALDDVGAGNAGLETLRRMPVDVIKIDRMVIANARADRASRAVLHAIVAFAAESGVEVVAEGIEEQQELALVQSVAQPAAASAPRRVHLVQGYLLGRPRPQPLLEAPRHAA
jgi:diguanylate cyclase (GGDEF)-like protein